MNYNSLCVYVRHKEMVTITIILKNSNNNRNKRRLTLFQNGTIEWEAILWKMYRIVRREYYMNSMDLMASCILLRYLTYT